MTATKWFVTTQATAWTAVGNVDASSMREYHAKTFGTFLTLCGANAMTWTKFYDRSFVDARPGSCPACSSALKALSAAGRRG